jgi:hypothetical protein
MDESEVPRVVTVLILVSSFTKIIVILRFIAARKSKRSFFLDDWLILLASVRSV